MAAFIEPSTTLQAVLLQPADQNCTGLAPIVGHVQVARRDSQGKHRAESRNSGRPCEMRSFTRHRRVDVVGIRLDLRPDVDEPDDRRVYDAFGVFGTIFRELEWKTRIISWRAVPKTPNVS
jgi:hypothetical protein